MHHSFVIFGASGDLTRRKLIPALYQLDKKGQLPDGTRVVGFSRTTYSDDQWRAHLREQIEESTPESFDAASWDSFAGRLVYHAGDLESAADLTTLRARLDQLEAGNDTSRVYYLATAPSFYEPAVEHLGSSGLADESHGVRRVVIEKPFGRDLPSAEELNAAVHHVFREHQVYRIDHYLGKESVQNILVLRFANSIFEPVWNRNYVDHVQITVAEEVMVGRRGSYYDRSGILRDMFQNHLLQLMMITAMEAPARFVADQVRDEKVKVLRAVRPLTGQQVGQDTLRGQYSGYLQEPGVAAKSPTATFAAVKLWIDNWRWQGVPFYLRSGKAMSCRTTQIVIQFREPPHRLFETERREPLQANRLVIQIQPGEGIQLHFQTKVPDAGMRLRMTDLDFSFQQEFRGTIPDAYERLLLDVVHGDASLFARSDEVELAWGIIDPVIAAWEQHPEPELATYESGIWGPESSTDWMHAQGRDWFDTCPVLH